MQVTRNSSHASRNFENCEKKLKPLEKLPELFFSLSCEMTSNFVSRVSGIWFSYEERNLKKRAAKEAKAAKKAQASRPKPGRAMVVIWTAGHRES